MKSVQVIVDTIIIVHPTAATMLYAVASSVQSYYILLYIEGERKCEMYGMTPGWYTLIEDTIIIVIVLFYIQKLL